MKFRTFTILLLLALLLVSVVPLTAQDATECEEGFRLYEHELGETCIPENPERIVTIGATATESLLALGILPVGFASWSGFSDVIEVPDYLADVYDLEESVYLGVEAQPNIELALTLEPDLIIIREWQSEIYPLLAEVAPTVAIEGYIPDEGRVTWKEFLADVGVIIGREAEVEALLAAYADRAETLRGLLGDDSPTVSLVRFDPSRVRLYLTTSYPGGIMQDAGIRRPESQDMLGFVQQISLETIQLADGDILLVAQGDPEAELFNQFTESPLWGTLEAVQRDAVYQVDHSVWIGGASVVGAHRVLDDLFRFVAGVDPVEVAPNPFLTTEPATEATEEASD